MADTLYGLNTINFCKGIGNVTVNGVPLGGLKQGTRVTLTPATNDADVDIRFAQAGGDLLGRRQGGTIYRLTCELAETPLANIRRAFDLSGVVAGNELPIGRSKATATQHLVQFFGIGPELKTRRWSFHECIVDRMPETVLGAEAEVNTLVISFLVCRDLDKAEEYCYGVAHDYVA